jgi:S-adenosylmethionine decarboxylase
MKHITLDIFPVNAVDLQDTQKLTQMLYDLPECINMQRATEPSVIPLEEHGITGFVIIYTSHISFHAYPSSNLLCLDVYSCNDFDEQPILDYVQAAFSIEDTRCFEINSIERATRSNRDSLLTASLATT